MSKLNYTELDATILTAIGRKKNNLALITEDANTAIDAVHAQMILRWQEANQGVAAAYQTARPEKFRIVDSRLQALRKGGKIAYTAKAGWQLMEGWNQ